MIADAYLMPIDREIWTAAHRCPGERDLQPEGDVSLQTGCKKVNVRVRNQTAYPLEIAIYVDFYIRPRLPISAHVGVIKAG
jgi:hypothetical protein